jgi:hypothetical protein
MLAKSRRQWQAARWVLIPYLGLLFGAISPRLIGLTDIDWLASLGFGLGLTFVIWVLLVLVRVTINLTEATSPLGETSQINWKPIGLVWLFSGAEEFYWMFLRGSIWELLLTLPEPPEATIYWAIWIAGAIAATEILWDNLPFTRWLLQIATLITTSILFLYSRNFWLCWFLHATIQLIFLPVYKD